MLATTLMGCGPKVQRQAMIVDSMETINTHNYSVNVSVVRGEDVNDATRLIALEDFKEALKTSIVSSKVFSEVVDNSNAKYFLEVHIINIGEPPGGASMHSTLISNWKLTLPSSGKVIWQEVISSSHTTPALAAFSGFKRVAMSIEGAARGNIKKGIEKLSKLEL